MRTCGIAWLLLGLLSAAAGCNVSSGESLSGESGEGAEKQSGASEGRQADDPEVLVRFGDFERGAISSRLGVAADLEAVHEAQVFAEVGGVVAEVKVEEGHRVGEEAPVIVLDDEELGFVRDTKQILFDQAETKLGQAELSLKESQSTLAQKRLTYEETQAEYRRSGILATGDETGATFQKLESERARIDKWNRELYRLSSAKASASDIEALTVSIDTAEREYRKFVASAIDEDSIVSLEELETKRYERDRARVDLGALHLLVSKQVLDRDRAEQDKKLAEVELKTAKLNVSRTVIEAPIAGHVSFLELKKGERVSTTERVFDVVDVSQLRARLHVPQRELRRLEVGQAVEIRSDIFPDRVFRARVSVINPVIDKDNGTIRVTVAVDSSPDLKPGMFVTGDVVLDTRGDATLVSKRAVDYVNQEPVIFLAREGVAHRYVLVPGYSDKDRLEVRGLIDIKGERHEVTEDLGRVVLVGHNNLKEGTPVREESPSARQESPKSAVVQTVGNGDEALEGDEDSESKSDEATETSSTNPQAQTRG
ncbi:MAG: efflux RND transporter periplasmic adaptor subunit [Planctomycetota bacterium]